MAWTTPRTWVHDEVASAATFNTHVRDNLNALRDYFLGAQDLGVNWEIMGARELRFQASGVAHGMTTLVDTDIWGAIKPLSPTAGGIDFEGFSDTDSVAARLLGITGSTTPTTAPVHIFGAKKNGTGLQALASGEALLNINNAGTTVAQLYGAAGMAIVGGLAVGYAAAAPGGAYLTIADANFKIWLNGGNPFMQMSAAGGGVAYDRTNGILGLISEAGTYSLRVASTGGLMIVNSGSPTDMVPRGVVQMGEVTAPGNSPANTGYVYMAANGGKTTYYARFPSGAAVAIVAEP